MKRFHVHVAVDNLADSIKFYSGMFAAEPSVVKQDYAKWMLDDPRINFAISVRDRAVGINHLGMQVDSAEELAGMQARLSSLRTDVVEQAEAACCYAKSDKYWVQDPTGIAWETFHTLDSIPVYGDGAGSGARPEDAARCCAPAIKPAASSCGTKSKAADRP
ncbi:ArsI/CadI family heavy metal resistance metalloenzyme [Massilia terrae]|uniref:VOC family protein n=1 Tax=Massilia terrae TaxID=1811224 RepID=A0ABT2D015_9BURK|nr:ArsI/CadI family heavy metal resistance metalloenzyme [Massilia terrae]MCS0659561.1 VOC family protein [Massilia terrae]